MIRVFAMMNPEDIHIDFNWQCQVNGISTQPLVLPQLNGPSTIQICFADGLDNTENVLYFQYSDNGPGTGTVVLDYLEYLPFNSSISEIYPYTSVSSDDEIVSYNGAYPTPISFEFGINGQSVLAVDIYATVQFTGPSF